jgi:hypothetical protein
VRDGRRVAGEHAPGLGQPHAAPDPLDQRDPSRFSTPQLLADGGLAVSRAAAAAGESSGIDRAALDVEFRAVSFRTTSSHGMFLIQYLP